MKTRREFLKFLGLGAAAAATVAAVGVPELDAVREQARQDAEAAAEYAAGDNFTNLPWDEFVAGEYDDLALYSMASGDDTATALTMEGMRGLLQEMEAQRDAVARYHRSVFHIGTYPDLPIVPPDGSALRWRVRQIYGGPEPVGHPWRYSLP